MTIKKHLFAAVIFTLVGCSESIESFHFTNEGTETANGKVYYASFEGVDTKAFVDKDLHLFWTKDDRLSIFEGNTYNKQFRYYGETGKNSATFEEVNSSAYVTGGDLTSNIAKYAIYPYDKVTNIGFDGAISFALPGTQAYAENSFGLRANTMVAVTNGMEDNFLSFKNVGGYLVFRFYGEGTVIKTITLTSQAGETLAGNAIISASHSSTPALTFKDDGSLTSSLTLDCGEGVELGSRIEDAKEFWFVVPPVTFSKGFVVTCTTADGSSYTRNASLPMIVERNTAYRITALEIVTQADLTDKTEPGVYSYDAVNHRVSTILQYDAGQDQYAVSGDSFRIQNLEEGYVAGVTLPSSSINQGTSYEVSIMMYGIDGYPDGTQVKTMVAEKVENDKVWLLEEGGSLGFIINTK
jgi:hypothetical protein